MAENKVKRFEEDILDFASANAFMSVIIHYKEDSLSSKELKDMAEYHFDCMKRMIAKEGGIPFKFEETINKDWTTKIVRSIDYDEETILGRMLSNDVIARSTKAGILVFKPRKGVFKITPIASNKKLEKIGYEHQHLSKNPYVAFMETKHGKPLNYFNCRASFCK